MNNLKDDPAARLIIVLMVLAFAMVSCGSVESNLASVDLSLNSGVFASISKALNNQEGETND